MIVKNEEMFLKQCLESIKGQVDEIIIVDTGSTDNTKEIAAKFTDKIYDFSWCNDFSAARNESLKHANGDWILVLDADEIISYEDQKKIKKLIEEKEVGGYFLLQRNYTNDSSVFGFTSGPAPLGRDYRGWFDSLIIRLFRNNPFVRFEGEVHERIDGTIKETSCPAIITPIIIHHYAEDKGLKVKKQKNMLYLRLAELKIKRNPKNATAHQQLATLYKEEGNLILAEREFKIALELDPHLFTSLFDLALVQQKQGLFNLAIENYSLSLKRKTSSEVYFGLGFCYFQKGDLNLSAFNFEKAIELNSSFLDAYINLGAIYEKKKSYEAAQKVFLQALKLSPQNFRIYYNLGVLHEKQFHLEQAWRCYKKALDLGCTKEGLKERTEKMGRFLCHQ